MNSLYEAKVAIIWIDESSFKTPALSLYSWVKWKWNTEQTTRLSYEKKYVKEPHWNKIAYFIIKSKTKMKINFETSLSSEIKNYEKNLKIKHMRVE